MQARGPSSQLPSSSPDTEPSVSPAVRSMSKEQIVGNLDIWRASGFPLAVSSCVLACCKGEQGGGATVPMSRVLTLAAGRCTLHMSAAGMSRVPLPLCA